MKGNRFGVHLPASPLRIFRKPCAARLFCYFCCAGGFCAGVTVAGFFAAGLFFTAGFFGGSLSSTIVFFGGAAEIAACAVFKSVRKRTISCSFDAARFASRSANCLRVPSKLLRSFDND